MGREKEMTHTNRKKKKEKVKLNALREMYGSSEISRLFRSCCERDISLYFKHNHESLLSKDLIVERSLRR